MHAIRFCYATGYKPVHPHIATNSDYMFCPPLLQVQTLLQQMQDKFQTMSDQIIGRIDEMSGRIDDLEKNIGDLMTQAGVEEMEAENKVKEEQGSA
uniref:Heat shock factor-binding protein 1 n=1 Tax=Oncorhynchus kisutch TaxID=8019 RepID=A0A8C7HJG2_ONCKI